MSFVITLTILLVFRPIFIMTKPDTPSSQVEYEYLTDPQFPPPSENCDYTISVGALFLWSGLAAGATGLLTYFTNRKPSKYPSTSP